MADESCLHNELRRSLQVLAAPWEEQRQHLERLFGERVAVDELGLEFDDVAPVVLPQGHQAGLSDEALRVVRDLADHLGTKSDRSEPRLWTVEALRDAPEWERVRTLAQSALVRLPTGVADLVRQGR